MGLTLQAETRKGGAARSDLRRMRERGKIPAVIYGKKVTSTPIAVEEKSLQALLKQNPNAIVELDIPEVGKHPVMINAIQRDSLQRNLLHIDFFQVNMDEPIRAFVALEFVGESPAQREGGVLTTASAEIEVRCLPQKLPAGLQVDISALEMGGNLLAKDIPLPADVELKTDENTVVATILIPQKAVEEPEEQAAEPEASEEAKVES